MAGPDLDCAGYLACLTLWRDKISVAESSLPDFRCIVQPNKGENQKKVFARRLLLLPVKRWALETDAPKHGVPGTIPKVHYDKTGHV